MNFDIPASEIEIGGGSHLCAECDKRFVSAADLQSHQAEHEMDALLANVPTMTDESAEPEMRRTSPRKRRRTEQEATTKKAKKVVEQKKKKNVSEETTTKSSAKSKQRRVKKSKANLVKSRAQPVRVINAKAGVTAEQMIERTNENEQENEAAPILEPNLSSAPILIPTTDRIMGGVCRECGVEYTKPWLLVSHMVDEHDAQLANLVCEKVLKVSTALVCQFCTARFMVPHDMHYHVLSNHTRELFGRDSASTAVVVEMLTTDRKRLSLHVRLKKKGKKSTRKGKPRNACRYGIVPSAKGPPGTYDIISAEPGSSIFTPISPPEQKSQNLTELRSVLPPCAPSQKFANIPSQLILEAEAQIRFHARGYQCSQCFRVRPTRELAIAHVYRLHMCASLRRFKCPHCPKNYETLRNLQVHVNANHGTARLFPCPHCPVKYKYPGDLKRHLKRANCSSKGPYKTYTCKLCGTTWTGPHSLTTHLVVCKNKHARLSKGNMNT